MNTSTRTITPGAAAGTATSAAATSPLFTKTYDLLHWLVPITLKFPRQQRFVGAVALQEGCQTLLARLLEAQRSERPLKRLLYADVALAQLRLNWRLAQDWQLVSPGQFEHGARLMDEVGRLLGAWLKAAKANAQRAHTP
jgi:hypothetical protein